MAANFIQVPPNSTGLKVDTNELVVGANTVERENMCISDPTVAANIATVSAAGALKVDGSAVTQPVSGTGSFTVAQATGTNLHVVVDTAPTTAVTLPAGQAVELLDSGGVNKASISAAGALKVDGSAVTQPVSGTVTANIGTTNGLALDASVTGLEVAQASTTSGQKGILVQGAVTTAAPTYTTAQTDPLSLTTAGALRVDGSGVTQPVSLTSTTITGTVAVTESGTWTNRIVGNAGATLDSTIGAATAPANALAISSVFQTTTPVLTAGQAVAAQCDVTGARYVNLEGRKNSYAAAKGGTVVAGDIAVLPGSASKTIKCTRVEVSCSTSGTPAFADLQLIKRSAADTVGTSTAMTVVPLDSGDAAGTAAPLLYSAAPTTGTAVGAVMIERFNAAAIGTANPTPRMIFDFGNAAGAQPVVLRGVAEQLAVNLSAVVATGTCNVAFQWTEE